MAAVTRTHTASQEVVPVGARGTGTQGTGITFSLANSRKALCSAIVAQAVTYLSFRVQTHNQTTEITY